MAWHKENSLVKGQKSNHLHNILFYRTGTDLCIYKELRAELSVWSGVNQCKGLFHMMHWADIIRNNACKCSTSFKSSFFCCADEEGEHYINNDNYVTYHKSSLFTFFREGWSVLLLLSWKMQIGIPESLPVCLGYIYWRWY